MPCVAKTVGYHEHPWLVGSGCSLYSSRLINRQLISGSVRLCAVAFSTTHVIISAVCDSIYKATKEKNPLLDEFSFIGILLVVSASFSAIALVAAWLIRPKRPNLIKADTYECGMETVGTSWVQFRVQYYIYALVFVVFDVEAVFLFPLAVAFDQLMLYMVLEMVLFIIILAVHSCTSGERECWSGYRSIAVWFWAPRSGERRGFWLGIFQEASSAQICSRRDCTWHRVWGCRVLVSALRGCEH